MDILCAISVLVAAACGGVIVYMLADSIAQLRIAAWLIANSKAMRERRKAYEGIESERRVYQAQLRDRLLKGIEIDGNTDKPADYTGI